MDAALDLNFYQDSMYSYSPDKNPSSALSHQPSQLSRHESDEISGLARDDYERGWNAGWYDGWGIAHRALSDIYTPPDYDHSSFKWRVDHHIL